jgi:hypothetical protein
VSAPSNLRTGCIIRADVNDPQGRPAGPHFCVILNKQAQIDAGVDLMVAVCTTTFHIPLDSGWFDMPSKPGAPGGHEVTGFTEATVVKATWIQQVPQSRDILTDRRSPRQQFNQVNNWLADKQRVMRTIPASP